ncbi:Subtilisin inhibitor 1 [Linum grandiflorum]
MIRSAFRLLRAASTATTVASSGFNSRKHTVFSPSLRWFHDKISGPNVNPVALQMIDYALSLPRSQKSDESYGEAMLMLEQCLASQSSDVEDAVTQNSKGMVLLAISNLSFERGNSNDAMEQLQRILTLNKVSLGVRVAALEALVGVNLELGNDDASSALADECLQLLQNDELASTSVGFEVADARAKALKGSVALSYGEFLHGVRNFSMARELYQKVIEGVTENKGFTDVNALAACNMASDHVEIAATCSMGQLQSHMGKFGDAEETLTSALNKAESLYGPRHPKVGVVLTCLALMFRQKAIQERSSSLLIQEGLYRRALELVKVPPLDSEAGYAEALCVQENRRSEGDKLKSWALAQWRNNRLSLTEALEMSESSDRVPVIDTRTARILRKTYSEMAEENQQTSEEQQPTQPLPRSYGMAGVPPSNSTASKVEWPELVGLTAEEAESTIKQEATVAGLQVHVIPANSFVTMDFRQDRVRLFVDADGKIARAPRIG